MTPAPPQIFLTGLALAGAALVGLGFQVLHVPLAWILGPLVATAGAAMVGAPVFAPVAGRRLGQVVVGISIGLNVTGAVVVSMLVWFPVMLVTTLVAVLCSAVVSVPFAALSGIDRKTAFFAMMPGGLSEMANLGAAAGGQPEPIALAQALRVALVVCLLPPTIVALDIHGTVTGFLSMPLLPPDRIGLAIVIALAGVLAARLLRLNNPWMIGALCATAIAAATGALAGRLPFALYALAQFMIGISIGARFRREVVVKLRRIFFTSALFILCLMVMLFGYAWLLSTLTGLDLATAALSASPGGIAEMAITAQTLSLSVGLVTGFHIVRAFMVNAFTLSLWNILHRIGLFALLDWVGGLGRRK
jgi:membrane AbrB-like protein